MWCAAAAPLGSQAVLPKGGAAMHTGCCSILCGAAQELRIDKYQRQVGYVCSGSRARAAKVPIVSDSVRWCAIDLYSLPPALLRNLGLRPKPRLDSVRIQTAVLEVAAVFGLEPPRGNNSDRRQWRKQGAAVGAAPRFLQAASAAQQKAAQRKREGPQGPGGTLKGRAGGFQSFFQGAKGQGHPAVVA